jgi:predicted transposase YdaD
VEIEVANISREALIQKTIEYLPEEKELIMTVAEQCRREGMQQGIQHSLHVVARSMLLEGFDPGLVAKMTKLPSDIVINLKKDLKQ